MQSEYQSPESRTATIEGSYSYTESGRRVVRSQRANGVPSEYFRYRVVKRFFDVVLVLISLPVLLPVLGIVSALVMLSSPGPVFLFAPANPERRRVLFDVEVQNDVRQLGRADGGVSGHASRGARGVEQNS